jgi:hypothetical protein
MKQVSSLPTLTTMMFSFRKISRWSPRLLDSVKWRVVVSWNFTCKCNSIGRDSSVGIATLQAGRSGDRIPVGAWFFAYSLGPTQLSVQCESGLRLPVRGVYHQTPSNAEIKGRIELYLYFSSEPLWPVLGRTLLLIYCNSMEQSRYWDTSSLSEREELYS